MTAITTVISDFGGVLTTPLMPAFAMINEEAGLDSGALGVAMTRVAERDGAHPLHELECGRITEPEFLQRLMAQLREDLGRDVQLHAFSERFFTHLRPNPEMLAFLAELRDRGYRLGLLTNNVREWEPRWRPMLPVDELFQVVVDSAFEGMRKPDPGIYELTCARLGVVPDECLFVDDFRRNCAAAEALGMHAVRFGDTEQAIAEMRAALDGGPPAPRA
ncbi:MAG: putative hydrolase of the superfamily [Solirubrobacteraceae bacterium]|nr:putative hydrolase of the superfamily [Solirubrobacteraceae bacterium]MEA2316279.1 putative hydrolase of the superfamily [Solirubrobacteraceae bacterium]